MSEQNRLCPMTFPSGNMSECCKERCAWWHTIVVSTELGDLAPQGCAMVGVSRNLNEIYKII